MTTRRNRPVQITDAPEHRSIPLDRVELRDSTDENEFILEGYASTFEEYEMYGGPANYGWIERIDPGAFDVTLRDKPDLHLLINHAGMPLARTKSGNLDLSVDDTGLKVVARLDRRDPEAQALEVKMQRGDMDEMSFAFRVKKQEWKSADGFEEDDQSYRTITEVSLHKGDVSVVNWGANPTTSAGVRSASDALKFLAECDEDELMVLRENDETLARAWEKLSEIGKPTERKVAALEDAIDIITLAEDDKKASTVINVSLDEERLDEMVQEALARVDIAAEIRCEGMDRSAFAFFLTPSQRNEGGGYTINWDREMVKTARELLAEIESRYEPAEPGMSLTEALALQGVLSDGETLSLREALAIAENV